MVSVIIPMKNSELFLRECLDSVVGQSYLDIEIILVDNGSIDLTIEIATEYSRRDERIIVARTMPGAGNARNYGINLASINSDYLCFLDSDDFFDFRMIEKMVSVASSNEADIVICKSYRYNNVSHKKRIMDYQASILLADEEERLCLTDEISEKIFQTTVANPWGKLFRTNLIKKYNLTFQNLNNSNDVSFVYTAMALANKICYIADSLVYYRTHHGSMCQGNKDNYPLDCLLAYTRLRELLTKFSCFERYYNSFCLLVRQGYEWNYSSLKDENAKKIMEQNKGKFIEILRR